MSPARLASIYRYPVKGFGAETLSGVELMPGRGIPFDRCLAIANGERALAPGGAWTPCLAFVRLTRNPDLPGVAVRFDEAARRATLRGPDGRTVTLALGEAAPVKRGEDVLAAWFKSGPLGPPRAARRDHAGEAGHWDHEDACLSIVNLETVALLARAADRPVDPLRFRANLHLADLPALAELALVEHRLRVGEALIEVLRPTDRCRATSVDPAGGSTDLNVPALLARALGHVYCGVYARVVEAGRIAPGDVVSDLGPAPEAVRDGAHAVTAPPVAEWPRPARVVERVAESASVVSLWVEDPLAGLRPAPRAGQHLRVHFVDAAGEAVWRAYTISGSDGSRLRLSIKRDGRASCHLHDALRAGDPLLVSGPFGDVVLPDGEGARPLLLLSAGIGITPTVAMLRELVTSGDTRPALVVHVARDEGDLALWAEARGLVGRLPRASARLHLTRAPHAVCIAHDALAGRPTFDALVREYPVREADLFLCGPPGFLSQARAALVRAGADPERVHTKAFAAPRAAWPGFGTTVERARPAAVGPYRVRFGAGRVEATWTPAAGTLLDLAEAAGLSAAANCRSGACGACRTRVLAGTVVHVPEPVLPVRAGTALLCCALPVGDVELA